MFERDTSTIPIKSIKDKKLKSKIRKTEKKFRDAATKAMESTLWMTEEGGSIQPENEMEKTWKLTQTDIKKQLDVNTQNRMFDIPREFGPYMVDYTRNGNFMLMGGLKGHVALYDWKKSMNPVQFYVNETVRDITWCHNETTLAVAQKKYTYLYDRTGMELYCLKHHIEANRLEFLPYHFLLVSVGNAGYLKYHDTSVGKLVVEHRTRLGKCSTMTQNPYNAVIHLGHANGTVTLWSPTMSTPLVKMLTHKGPVQAIAIDQGGYYMATAGLDNQLKIWDIRTFKNVHNYYTPRPATCLSISQKGLLAIGYGPNVVVWKDLKTKHKEPFLKHLIPSSTVQDLKFCPFEDVLGVGHSKGFTSMMVPGAGEANFDALEVNPFETKKQRQEREVHQLLDKIQPDMIALDPTFVGKLDRAPQEVLAEEKKLEWQANHPNEKFEPKTKARGKSSAMRRYLRKKSNVIDEKREAMRERLAQQNSKKTAQEWHPLSRFQRSEN